MTAAAGSILDFPIVFGDLDALLPFNALDAALSALPVLAFVVDWEGNVIQWSRKATEILGPSREDAVGRSLENLDVRWDLERIFALAVAATCDESQPVRELVRVDGDGDRFLVLTLSAVSLPDQRGVLVLGEDATARAAQQEQDLHSRKLEAIGQLAAGIAHEINTPMQYIADNTLFLRDALETLLDPHAGDGHRPEHAPQPDSEQLATDMREALVDSIHGIERIAAIVKAMKAFSHPSTSSREAVDLNRAVETAVVVTRNEWKYVAEVVQDLDPARPTIQGSSGELHQVLLNLLVNAAHAIEDVAAERGEKGRIEISTRQTADHVELILEDTGCGIPDAIRGRIFDPFFTTKEIGRGTGQGLALVHSIVCDRHGGTIDVRSRVDSGTRFRLRFPRR